MIRSFLVAASLLSLAVPTAAEGRDGQLGLSPVAQANHEALLEPSSTGYLNAIQVYPYAEGTLYRLYAAPERITEIALQPGEKVTSVAAGDTVRWTVGDTTSGSGESRRVHIFIKPFSAGLRTNLVITTDRRAYRLQLESTAKSAMAAIAWSYPQDALIALRREQQAAEAATPVATGLTVEKLNFNYRISGDDPAWRPLRAFDDGRQTFVEFPPSIAQGEAPPLFVIGDNGEAQLVNYRMAGRYYVVDRLFGMAELRLGESRQQVVRIRREGGRRSSRSSDHKPGRAS